MNWHVAPAGRSNERSGEGEDRLPLLPGQEALTLGRLEDSNLKDFNFNFAFRLRGQLDLGRVRDSYHELIRRHASLRTHFAVEEGGGYKQIVDSAGPEIEYKDLDGAGCGSALARAKVITKRMLEAGPDLGQAGVRAAVLRLNTRDHVVSVSLNHLLCDARSVATLWNDWNIIYAVGTHAAEPGPLPMSYAQYVRQTVAQYSEVAARALEFWRDELGVEPTYFELPGDFPRSPAHVPRYEEVETALPHGHVVDTAKRLKTTPFSVLLGCWCAVLSRATREREILVRGVFDGRTPATQKMVGLFAKMLPIRVHSGESKDLATWVQSAQAAVLGALTHQDVPYRAISEALKFGTFNRDQSFSFNMIGDQQEPRVLFGLDVDPLVGETPWSLDNRVMFQQRGSLMTTSLIFDSKLYAVPRMQGLADDATELLQALALR